VPGDGAAGGRTIQGPSAGPFSAVPGAGAVGAPYVLTTGYLGDLGLAGQTASGQGLVRLHVERYFTDRFVRSALAGASGGAIQTLTLALDYRSDALVVWVQGGSIYARDLPATGPPHAVQRLAAAGSRVAISAVLSDNYRGTVAWSEQHGNQTSVFLDRSATGVTFVAPKLVDRFLDVDGLSPPPASPRLVRTSTESVLLAWSGVASGRWVVHTVPIDEDEFGVPDTVASPSGGALLADLEAGPRADVVLLWTAPPPSGGDGSALFAARGVPVRPRRFAFTAPEQLAPVGASGEAAVGVDPGSDRALAVWRTSAGHLQYAVREATDARPSAKR
jgi:hypothetical protein